MAFPSGGAWSQTEGNLLVNGGFEVNSVAGTIPWGWSALDENAGYERWTACRSVRSSRGVLPAEGEWMAVIDTELMGIDTNGEDFGTPRAALYQTIELPAGSQASFSVLFNDIGSTSGGWVAPVRLGVTFNSRDIRQLTTDETSSQPKWSKPFYKADIVNGGSGDWTEARQMFEVPDGEGPVKVTCWIGMFDNSSGTEQGYWRVDNARVTLER